MFDKYYTEVLDKWNISNERRFIKEAIKQLGEQWEQRNIFIVEAPTGYGKSTIAATLALWALREGGKIILAYPLRALLEDQHSKLVQALGNTKLLGKRYMGEHTSPYLIAPVTLTTIDTLSMTMFGLAPEDLNHVLRGWSAWDGTITDTAGHYLFSWSTVMLSDIVLDEVHLLADETRSLNYLVALLKHTIKANQHIILMSATLPSAIRRVLESNLGGDVIKLSWVEYEDHEFDGQRLEKRYELKLFENLGEDKHERILEWVKDAKRRGFGKALVIFNTVRDAIEFYRRCHDKFDEQAVLLLHSRFASADRERKMRLLSELKEAPSYLIVSTQVVEAGVDITSNVIVTELAPPNSLIQRFGRFLRYEGENEGVAYVWADQALDSPHNAYKVYDKHFCQRTLAYLRQNAGSISMHVPGGEQGYKKMLDTIYGQDAFRVEARSVDEMLLTYTNFGDISHAVRLFVEELEGSFVGRSLMISITPEHERIEIPIGLETWKHILGKRMVVGALVKGDKIATLEELDLTNLDALRHARNIIKVRARHDITSFIVRARYDSKLGLLLPEDAGYE